MNAVRITCGLLILFAANRALAAEPAAISSATLGDMGLATMQTLSDEHGTAVRGMGAFTGHHFDMGKTHVRFDHKKTEHRKMVDHRGGHKMDHRGGHKFEKSFHHKNFGHDFGHKKMDTHKSFGFWQPRTLGWHFGGPKLR
jgi:hypothetical protein